MAFDRIRGNPKGRIVLLDTSAIFMVFEQSIRLEDELDRLLGLYSIKILEDIKMEIVSLATTGSGKQRQLAKTALSFIEKYEIIPNESQDSVDDTLFDSAKRLSATVVTNDVVLRRRLTNHGIQTICLRGKNQLMIC
jgi:rRNA-processing protein FCF1